MLTFAIISIILVALDQITKLLVINNFNATTEIKLIPNVINLVFCKNTGAAFSIFSDYVNVLGLVSVVFCIGLLIFVVKKKPTHILCRLSLSLVFAGALGNAIDRIFRGFVIDFIETDFITFPVFNIADIAITIGAILLMIYILFFDSKK